MTDFTKPVRTKFGYIGGNLLPSSFQADEVKLLLENIPQKRSGWVNIKVGYLGHRAADLSAIYQTKELAEKAATLCTCKHLPAYIEWEE